MLSSSDQKLDVSLDKKGRRNPTSQDLAMKNDRIGYQLTICIVGTLWNDHGLGACCPLTIGILHLAEVTEDRKSVV